MSIHRISSVLRLIKMIFGKYICIIILRKKLLEWRILLLSGHIVQQINCCHFGLLLLLLLIVIRRKDSVSNLSFGRYTFGINFELHGSSFSATPPASPPSCPMTWWSDNNTQQPYTAEGQKVEGNSMLIWDHLNEMTGWYCQQKILNSDKWKFYVYFSESVRIFWPLFYTFSSHHCSGILRNWHQYGS